MRALTLERWALDPGLDTAGPSEQIPYAFTWTDTADPSELQPYAFHWDTGDPEEEDAAAPDWNAGFQGVASGLGTGAAIGTALGTVFPGIGNAVGGAIGGAVGAIGGFFAGLFGGKKGGGQAKPKPTPRWVVDLLEEGRRALKEVPPNPSKMLDATLVAAGKLTREGYLRAKRAGELPSQKYDRNRSAVMAKSRAMDKKFAPQIEAHLKGLSVAEKALVSAAMPLGQGSATLEAIRAIRARKESATRQKPAQAPPFFPPDVIERMRRQYLAQRAEPEQPSRPPEIATAPAPPPPQPEDEDAPEPDGTELDTSGPSPVASAPTLEALPKPLWHVSTQAMPRHVFEWLLYNVPALRNVPTPLLRAMAGKGPKVQDTSGIDAVSRQYVMMPGETFAGVAAQLTGDPARAVELHAANPHWTPDRTRLEIPPGWIEWTPLLLPTSGDTGQAEQTSDEPKKSDAPKKEQSKPATVASKDTERPSITKRVIEVLANDWPEKIAIRVGAKKIDQQWWRTLKSVNPHKVIAPNGNFQTLYAGEHLNYPDTWPQHIEAKPAPGQPGLPSTPPWLPPLGGVIPPVIAMPPQFPWPLPETVPAGATSDFGVTFAAQCVLVVFAKQHAEIARPQDYGTAATDLTGTQTERMRSILSTFQLWWNTRNPSPMLRVDGVLDSATHDALRKYAADEAQKAPIPLPSSQSGGAGPVGPAAPSGNGGGAPSGQSPGGSSLPPWKPGPLVVLNAPSSPPATPPADDKPAKTSKDDGAAALMVGGTVLSLLLR